MPHRYCMCCNLFLLKKSSVCGRVIGIMFQSFYKPMFSYKNINFLLELLFVRLIVTHTRKRIIGNVMGHCLIGILRHFFIPNACFIFARASVSLTMIRLQFEGLRTKSDAFDILLCVRKVCSNRKHFQSIKST